MAFGLSLSLLLDQNQNPILRGFFFSPLMLELENSKQRSFPLSTIALFIFNIYGFQSVETSQEVNQDDLSAAEKASLDEDKPKGCKEHDKM